MIGSLRQGHLLPVMTPAAILRRVGRIDSHVGSASFFRFAGQFAEKLRPRGIGNALRKTMVVGHAVDMQVFHTDDPVPLDNPAAFLMGEVVSSEGNPFMHTGNHLAMVLAFSTAFGQLALFPLDCCQCLLFLAKKARVGDLAAIRKGGKSGETNVNTHLLAVFWQAVRFDFTREGHRPFAGPASLNRTGLDRARDRAVIHQLESTHFGDHHALIMREAEPTLGEGEASIAPRAFEARVSWCFSGLAASEKGLEGQIDTYRDVLQDLGVDTFQLGAFGFQDRKRVDLPIAGQRLPLLLRGVLALFQQVVIEPATFLKYAFKGFRLLFGRIYPVRIHCMHTQVVAQKRQGVKREAALPLPQTRHGALIPRMNDGGFPASDL